MAKKKKIEEATKAEAYYIEQHWGGKTAEEIAADLEIAVEKVAAYIEKLTDAGLTPPKPPEKPTNVEKAGFAVHDPVDDETGKKGNSFSTAMTGAGSHLGDEATKQAVSGGEKFMRTRLKNSIHVIDPNRPCR